MLQAYIYTSGSNEKMHTLIDDFNKKVMQIVMLGHYKSRKNSIIPSYCLSCSRSSVTIEKLFYFILVKSIVNVQ